MQHALGVQYIFPMGAGSNNKKLLFFSQLKADFIDQRQYMQLMYKANEKSPNMGKIVYFSTKRAL